MKSVGNVVNWNKFGDDNVQKTLAHYHFLFQLSHPYISYAFHIHHTILGFYFANPHLRKTGIASAQVGISCLPPAIS